MSVIKKILMSILFIVIGVFLLRYGIVSSKEYKEKDKIFIETIGRVVDYDYNSDDLRAIIVEYEVGGQKYRKQSNSYSNAVKSIGTEISLKYNPNNPNDAIWSEDNSLVFASVLGGIFVIVGVIAIFKRV